MVSQKQCEIQSAMEILLIHGIIKHTESQYEKFKADKEEELLDLQRNYKRQLINAEDKMR